MWGQEIFNAVEEFLNTRNIIRSTFKYRNPESSEYSERDFNPFQLKRIVEEMGFKARVGPGAIQCSGV